MKFRINESIRLTAPIHSALLEAGAIGLIVEIFLEPEETYEIEFSDERGATTHQLLLHPHEIQRLES
ncbi:MULTISPECIES: DUF4926 domain-containing protein [Variovorax]|jgi:Domain of unknown function (DUF4926)|uniref:DUF4926 domain-containing protein n=1 Tax=Variovorax guangxiensis TaxID=1775474 RepID=A0A840FRK9_9BURK|nr:DUF4926 domain-containing protein [Variovorax guangxiensis]MBB4225236.1 hypothetical protein [Variovorax guangxiensis]